MTEAFKNRKDRVVLLIEDDEMVRRTSKSMLMRLGFSVIEASDGFEAIEVFHQHRDIISLIICDLSMPHMNGFDTLAALRSLAPDLLFILASGYFDPEIMKGDSPQGPHAFLSKPFTLEDLGNTIAHALSGRGKRN
jgi:two-component system, cell cycle sensor histidine kinase and response regulator CckA